jgi:hypothetical protein
LRIGALLQRDFALLRDFDSYYEILRFTLIGELKNREEIAMSSRTRRINRRASRRPPASGRKPSDKMSARDVNMSGDELLVFHRQFQVLFKRREQRNWSLRYLCGQLSNLERKTIEPMVLAQSGADPNAIRGMQQFIGQGKWDSTPLMIHAQSLVSSWFGEEDGVVIVDGSGFPKEGDTRWAWRGNTVDIWERSPIVRKGSSWCMPVGTAMRFWTNACMCRKSGSAMRLASAGKLVGFQRRWSFTRSRSWVWR